MFNAEYIYSPTNHYLWYCYRYWSNVLSLASISADSGPSAHLWARRLGQGFSPLACPGIMIASAVAQRLSDSPGL
eukprot:2959884-Rhodomonas_salina.1